MPRIPFATICVLLGLLAGPLAAEQRTAVTGGDVYISGSGGTGAVPVERDLFAAGGSVTVSREVSKDANVTGLDIDIEATVAEDLQAIGGTVTLRGEVGEDVSAAGATVRLAPSASVLGNARLVGGTVRIEGPIAGALVAAGGEIILDAEIGGDVRLTTGTLSFGPNARIGGRLDYSAPEAVDIPETVIASDRVGYRQLERMDAVREAHDMWQERDYPVMPTFMTLFAGFLVSLAFFMVIGSIFLAFLPRQVAGLRQTALERPGVTLLVGVIGLSMMLGLIPISAMTIIGIPLVPIVVLGLIVLWTLGYILGAYVMALRLWQGFGGQIPGIPGRLMILAAGVTLVALFNFIPFLGWLLNFALVLLGIGAITTAVFDRLIGRAGPALDVDMNPVDES